MLLQRLGRRPPRAARAALRFASSSLSSSLYDFVIVGGGSAGCVLANRLSANPAVRVLLLEAGGDDRFIPFVHIPVGYLWSIANPKVDWMFKTEPIPGLDGRVLNYPRGKLLGGCSSINGMIYMRGQAQDYDAVWAPAVGHQGGWTWAEVLPYFVKGEDYHNARAADGKVHGTGREWRVERQRVSWEILDAFREAAAEQGIPKVEDFNRGDNMGSSYFEVNQKGGVRWNTSKGFLHPVRAARPNLTVRTCAHVTRVLFDERRQRATGVEFFVAGREGQLERATAGLETVLSAGAVGSPQLLQLSGVGPAALLRERGVGEVVLDAPGVGADLQDHIQIRTVYRVEGTRTLNDWYASLWGRVEMAWQYLRDRSGPLSMAPSQLGVFAASDAGQSRANLEYHVQPLSLDRFGEPLHTFPAITAGIVPLQPTSRGSVAIRDRDPRSPPIIQPNYLATAEDRQVAADAIRLTRRIVLDSQALAPFKPREHLPTLAACPRDAPDAALAAAAARIATTIFHPSCTCRMGQDGDAGAVLDPFLRVRGLEALTVADASAMPRITSGNTNSPTIMIAEKAADFLHARHGTGVAGGLGGKTYSSVDRLVGS